jgi:hypothetical protein
MLGRPEGQGHGWREDAIAIMDEETIGDIGSSMRVRVALRSFNGSRL